MKLLQEPRTAISKQKLNTVIMGYVFDIKRFAVHDGSGIRTTVFLKGCPLRCKWCQNPEGLKATKQIIYMKNKCILCGSCAQASKHQGVQLIDGKIVINRKVKDNWNEIVDSCPTMAMRYDSDLYTVEEIAQELSKDVVFFKRGGGVTISGGEPFMQHEFMLNILKACKQMGIHTAIESSLYVSNAILQNVVPYVDEIFADMKIFDRDLHHKYTGVYNDVIKENIKWLLHSDYADRLIIRMPLIPQMTATSENIAQIAKFISSNYSDVKYEMLNYNPLAKAKYSYLDMDYCFDENPKLYTQAQMDEFYQIALNNGIKNLLKE